MAKPTPGAKFFQVTTSLTFIYGFLIFRLPAFGRVLYMIVIYLFPILLGIGFGLIPIQKGAKSEFLTELVEVGRVKIGNQFDVAPKLNLQ